MTKTKFGGKMKKRVRSDSGEAYVPPRGMLIIPLGLDSSRDEQVRRGWMTQKSSVFCDKKR